MEDDSHWWVKVNDTTSINFMSAWVNKDVWVFFKGYKKKLHTDMYHVTNIDIAYLFKSRQWDIQDILSVWVKVSEICDLLLERQEQRLHLRATIVALDLKVVQPVCQPL